MDINELLESIKIIDHRPGTIAPLRGLAYHSGQVKQGDLFVCIRGYKTDGHKFINQAIDNGAVSAVVESFQDNISIPQYLVKDSRLALATLADRYFNHPSRDLIVTGVTATNGKTTTTYMIDAILSEHGFKTGLIGTVVIKTGEQFRPALLTTPESLDLHRYFREMVDQHISHATMEVSSSGLELKRVSAVDFNTLVVNNISREHIDLHGSFEAYFAAKASLVRNSNMNQWAVFNLDCPLSAPLVSETAAKTFTYGVKTTNADCVVHNLDLSSGRARFTVELRKKTPADLFGDQPESFSVELSVLGLHSVYNAMAAILVALLHKIPTDTIARALKQFKGVERRFELIFEDDFMVIDDHFANSGNIHVTLETLQMMKYKRLHLVYAIRGSRGVTVNRENAEALAHWAPRLGIEKIIATTSNGHVGEKDLVTPEELAVFKKVMSAAGIKTEIYAELPEAIARGLSAVNSSDVLLLAGCQGMDYGASVCLTQIQRLRPDLPQNTILAALKNRVAGI
ncbi:MAG: UDP-N-acetylmuramyl-tripeptide synthetase [Dethiobacteria bacterium]|nr:UDP-N-acetylmuramyl-tripeptide synthetase [Dethiobacteria bacterium]